MKKKKGGKWNEIAMATESPVSCALLDSKKEEAANRFLLNIWYDNCCDSPHYQDSMLLNSSMYLPAGTSQLKSVSISFFCRARNASLLSLYRSRARLTAA